MHERYRWKVWSEHILYAVTVSGWVLWLVMTQCLDKCVVSLLGIEPRSSSLYPGRCSYLDKCQAIGMDIVQNTNNFIWM
jgi:hypothetical protein